LHISGANKFDQKWKYVDSASGNILLQYYEFGFKITNSASISRIPQTDCEEIERSVFLELRDISVSATKYNTHCSIVTKIA